MLDTRAALVVCTTLAALLSAAGTGGAQPAERSLVVSVVDGDGAPVPGLQPRDFEVREDGAAREVLRAARDTRPRQIALLVDTSEAALGAASNFRNGVNAFVDALHPESEIAIISFGGRPRILVPSTREVARLRQGAAGIFAYSRTAAYLLDAMSETTRGFVKRGAARPVMVVLATEGLDHSHADSKTLIRDIEEAGVTVHMAVLTGRGSRTSSEIAFGPVRSRPPGFVPPGFGVARDGGFARWRLDRDLALNRAPLAGGGRRRDMLASMAAEATLQAVAAELLNQYLVVYSRPATLIPPRDVEVRVARDGVDVRDTPVPEAR
jgi:VWFA-related protein